MYSCQMRDENNRTILLYVKGRGSRKVHVESAYVRTVRSYSIGRRDTFRDFGFLKLSQSNLCLATNRPTTVPDTIWNIFDIRYFFWGKGMLVTEIDLAFSATNVSSRCIRWLESATRSLPSSFFVLLVWYALQSSAAQCSTDTRHHLHELECSKSRLELSWAHWTQKTGLIMTIWARQSSKCRI